MSTGQCRHCGYSPVAKNAPICPNCAGNNPNPSALARGCQMVVLLIIAAAIGFAILAGIMRR